MESDFSNNSVSLHQQLHHNSDSPLIYWGSDRVAVIAAKIKRHGNFSSFGIKPQHVFEYGYADFEILKSQHPV